VASVGSTAAESNQLYHVLYDGTVMDEHGFTVLGGQADSINTALEQEYQEGCDLGAAVRLGAKVLGEGQQAAVPADQLEVALLDRNRPKRTFRRIRGAELEGLLAG
jgi:proteasome alpha subunit